MGIFGANEHVYKRIFDKAYNLFAANCDSGKQPWSDIEESFVNTMMYFSFVCSVGLVEEFTGDVMIMTEDKRIAVYLSKRFEEIFDERIGKSEFEEIVNSYLSSYLLLRKMHRSTPDLVLREMAGKFLKSCDIDVCEEYVDEICRGL